jgi:hypothetical protein
MQKSKSSSNVGHLVSKKIWKSRSKSQIRAQQVAAAAAAVSNMIIPPPGSAFGPDGLPLKSQWTPQVRNIQNKITQLIFKQSTLN